MKLQFYELKRIAIEYLTFAFFVASTSRMLVLAARRFFSCCAACSETEANDSGRLLFISIRCMDGRSILVRLIHAVVLLPLSETMQLMQG
jgi:hypothetical protein